MKCVVRDASGGILFQIETDKTYAVGTRFGFNFDNAPNVYAVFTVLRVEGGTIYVGLAERVIK